jgi:NADH:ubiquinone oxidoreductase subunit H
MATTCSWQCRPVRALAGLVCWEGVRAASFHLVQATLPRFRYDQLMTLPEANASLALANAVVTALLVAVL